MKISVNPILKFSYFDKKSVENVYDMCDNMAYALAQYTFTDDACITCADNGEVFVTEKEIFDMMKTLETMKRIINEAPKNYDTNERELAIDFSY